MVKMPVCAKLTVAQHRELEKIAGAPTGHPEGKGAEWSVRACLRAAGLLELRKVLEIRPGKLAPQHSSNMWFVTDAGRVALGPIAVQATRRVDEDGG
jgi:hypothetical protein